MSEKYVYRVFVKESWMDGNNIPQYREYQEGRLYGTLGSAKGMRTQLMNRRYYDSIPGRTTEVVVQCSPIAWTDVEV